MQLNLFFIIIVIFIFKLAQRTHSCLWGFCPIALDLKIIWIYNWESCFVKKMQGFF